MKFSYISLTLSSLAAIANAASWTFNVVNIGGVEYDMGLKYNDQVIKMTEKVFPLYTTTIESGDGNLYKYVLLDKSGNVVEEEEINREYIASRGNINEVYDRVTKNVDVPPLPKVYDPLYPETDAYKDFPQNEIYTLYAKCDEEAYNGLKYSPISDGHKNLNFAACTVNLITPKEYDSETGSIFLVGFNSRHYKKLSWKFKLDKKILGRKTIKVRAIASDPTLMRDKLSSELYKSLGVPVTHGTYVRVMINDDIWGLYSIVDTIGGKWIASNIHGNDDAHVGYNYKMYSSVPDGPFASLRYLGENPEDYNSSGSYEVDEIDKDDPVATSDFYRLAEFTKMFEEWSTTYANDQSEAAVTALEKFFNLESLLRQLVVEALTVAYDNFWAQTGNYALYYNPEKDQYQIIPYDFDGTFYGSNGSPYYATDYLSDCIGWADNTAPDKYFVNNLFKHEPIKKRYKEIMDKTIKKVFNVDSVTPFIDGVADLIREDVAWNFDLIDDLDSNIPGFVNHFTISNFDDNTNFKKVDYNSAINYNDAHYGLKEWIKTRGGYCATYSNGASANEVVPTPKLAVNPVVIKSKTEKPTTVPKPTTAPSPSPAPVLADIPTMGSYSRFTTPKVETNVSSSGSVGSAGKIRITKKVTVKKVVTVTKYVVKE